MVAFHSRVAWTKRALRVMHLAHEEARYANAPAIGIEHILLGLLREGRGMGAKILRTMQIDEYVVRQTLHMPHPLQAESSDTIIGPLVHWLRRWWHSSSIGSWDALHLNGQARSCLDKAMDEVQALHVRFVGTEHLLFGLASVEEVGNDAKKELAGFQFAAAQIHEHIVRLYRNAHIIG